METLPGEIKPEARYPEGPQDFSDFFFKSLEDFLLFTSGYYELRERPIDEFISMLNDNVIIELYSVQTAFVSSISSLFGGQLRIPALAVEFFLNNRFQAELIIRLADKRGIKLDERIFLQCLTGVDEDHYKSDTEPVEKFLRDTSKLVSRDIIKKSSQSIFDRITREGFQIFPVMNVFLSGLFTYVDTKNLATHTERIFNSK